MEKQSQFRRENRVRIDGRIFRMADLKYIPNGSSVLSGTLMFGGNKNKNIPPNFINFTMWNPEDSDVDFINNAYENKLNIKLVGYLSQKRWEDKNGAKRSNIEVGVQSVQLDNNLNKKQTNVNVANTNTDDDIPF